MTWSDFELGTSVVAFLSAVGLIMYSSWCWITRLCGRHEFMSRSDTTYVDGKGYETRYVRDVCTHCGATVERKPEAETSAEVISEEAADA